MRIQRIAGGGNNETRILIRASAGPRSRIETSPVMRGTVMPPRSMQVAETVEDEFGFAEMQVVSFEDLSGASCTPPWTGPTRGTCTT